MSFSCTSAAPLGSCHYLLHLHSLSPSSCHSPTPPAGYPAAVYPAIYCVASAVACSERSSLCLVACTLRRLELYLLCSSLLHFSLYTLSLSFSLLFSFSLQFAVVVFISAAQFCAVLLPQSCANKLRCSREAGNKLLLLRSRDAKLMGN